MSQRANERTALEHRGHVSCVGSIEAVSEAKTRKVGSITEEALKVDGVRPAYSSAEPINKFYSIQIGEDVGRILVGVHESGIREDIRATPVSAAHAVKRDGTGEINVYRSGGDGAAFALPLLHLLQDGEITVPVGCILRPKIHFQNIRVVRVNAGIAVVE